MRNYKYFLFVILLLTGLLPACVKEAVTPPASVIGSRPLLTILKNNYAFSMFYTSLQRTGLDKTLEGKGPFTLLAPDNDAFALSGISADSLARIDTATLRKLIGYHIIPDSISYASIPQTIDFPYTTLAGAPVYFSQPRGVQDPTKAVVHINGVTVNKTDIRAGNGYIIALSKVLYYPAASVKDILEKDPQYSYFIQGLKQFGMWEQLDKPGPFVIMAPTNAAFEQYGIDETTLAQLDTVGYKKFLFSPYVLSPYLFFISDLIDAPVDYHAPPGIVTPDFIQVPSGSLYYPPTYVLIPLNWQYIQNYPLGPYYGNIDIWTAPVKFVNTDYQADNGVVHGLSGLVMPPDSARINP